ncbi:MAG: leucyl aminopeptidase family protein [Rhodospirillales bacterium]|nr:leucyl aminopeptidase family protein [Rhodospirillales bacterium]
MVTQYLVEGGNDDAVPLVAVTPRTLDAWLAIQPEAQAAWIDAAGFDAEAGSLLAVPGGDGRPAMMLVGLDAERPMWSWAGAAARLPKGTYRVATGGPEPVAPEVAALGWALGTYEFRRYKQKEGRGFATLQWPAGCDRGRVVRLAGATRLVRDLVNLPALDLGPAELAEAAAQTAAGGGADFREIVGDDLVAAGYPAIHAVGQGSPRAPRLIDITWGDAAAPKVTLVGKGVCFDTGGLDIKPPAAMKWMKKDMAGAAHVLGLAAAVMDAGLAVRLRVLIPAVENSVSGKALRPHDVIRTRKGLTAEIANTDAEGRLVLADALAEAASENPALIVDFATLTGAARVALGPDLPALFSNDDGLAEGLLREGQEVDDPLWRLPLFKPYRRHIDGNVADLSNAPDSPYAGAITAALFLAEFVEPHIPWAHLDIMAWNAEGRPGRPEGGEAMGLRAAYGLLAERFG